MTRDVDHVCRRWAITGRIGRLAARELVLSAVFLVVSVMIIGVTAGSAYWKLIVVDNPAIVSLSGGWCGLVVAFLLGGFVTALICFGVAFRFRGVTRHFRPMAALIGNVATSLGALGLSALYGGRWEWQVWIIAAAVLGVGAFWLSLLPLSDRVAAPDSTRAVSSRDAAPPPDLEVI
ncbi:hypothetical protein [Microbacterium sp. TNHR37B]|uniref:hypothetical protein n=1 Tax=Microbacterium sp. TNHR37B TaxID=1775956 RepID=UPI0007B24400|nr:hypothetical protein [Microbacterium sp. TNHR37B]KZE89707.1 hypothetical protein AVP41_02506 [Microbacterium sp. TNHR37B]